MSKDKRAKITDEHRQEAALLRALWESKKGQRLTQEKFGEAYGLGGQAMIGHYLAGRSALHEKAAAAFAAELGCKVSDFSPRLAETVAMLARAAEPPSIKSGTPTSDRLTKEERAGYGIDPDRRIGDALDTLHEALSSMDLPTRERVGDLLAKFAASPGHEMKRDLRLMLRPYNRKSCAPSLAQTW